MRILITTGIYPPEIGGPAQYAKNLKDIWQKSGYPVSVKVFSKWNILPTGLRHIFFFFYIIPNVIRSDFVLTLDTFSAALPTLFASKIFRKKMILRIGGDFLWESYVERTGDLVLLSQFYETKLKNLSFKEKIIFKIIRFILSSADAVIWSTKWQRDIFIKPYGLEKGKHFIVENYYGKKKDSNDPTAKVFISATRKLKLKNIKMLESVFNRESINNVRSELDIRQSDHDDFIDRIKNSYAVIVASLGDISPNNILDAIMYNKPFIVTKETGLYERLKDIAIFIDPKNPNDIEEKVLWLSNEENYAEQKRKVEAFNFTHSWEAIAGEYIEVYKNIK